MFGYNCGFYDKQIRAGHLSGDCHYKRELLRGYLKLRGHEQVSFHMDISINFPDLPFPFVISAAICHCCLAILRFPKQMVLSNHMQ